MLVEKKTVIMMLMLQKSKFSKAIKEKSYTILYEWKFRYEVRTCGMYKYFFSYDLIV